jgi:hypothetical protein
VFVATLVIVALAVGLGLGLLFGWVVMPVKYVDTAIADLKTDYKEEYILLVASAYAYDQDLEKAQARLEMLEAPNINQWLGDMIDRYIDEEQDEEDIRALVALAYGLGVQSPRMVAYQASPTPVPTDTPLPSPTAAPTDTPTITSVPPTETPTTIPPTDTSVPPTNTPEPQPTNTSAPSSPTPVPPTATPVPPTATPVPPTNTPKPQPTNTPKPQPTNTPKPPPAAGWTVIEQRLLGPNDGLRCDEGNLQVRVTVVDAGGNQIPGIWVYDKYSQQYQVTGNINSPDWGPGQTKFEYGIGGGGSLCIAGGEGAGCVSGWTRDMPCYYLPPIQDMYSAGYCNCCEPDISLERCQQLINEGKCWSTGAHHFSWNVVFKRN